MKTLPKPLFDTLENNRDEPLLACVSDYLIALFVSTTIPLETLKEEYQLTREFLVSYSGSPDTYTAYRREVERLLQWAWLVAKKPIKILDRNDIRSYFEFASQPPPSWIGAKTTARFMNKKGERVHNPKWRPFSMRITKSQHKQGQTPDKNNYLLTSSSLHALFASVSTYFTFLQQEGYLEINPVQLVRQKSRFLQKRQSIKVTRKLSQLQWDYVINSVENLANQHPEYERHLFLISSFYLLGLRISELADTPGRIPKMGDFAPDKHSRWWFTTVGKGNKQRDVAVPDSMLEALKRYRSSLSLSALPSRGEQTPLVHKQRGKGGLGTRQIRNIVQECFDFAILNLKKAGKNDEAEDLETATVHWLRHTSISADVEHRPREHVRDDAGHENANITERYIDADRAARHQSAKNKILRPQIDRIDI